MDRILSHSPIGIATIDFGGNYVEFNAAYSNLYGFDAESLKHESFTIVFSPEQRASVLARHQKFLTEGGELRGEWDVVRHDGKHIAIISESVSVKSDSGQPLRLVYVLDITQRRQAEQALLQSEKRLMTILDTTMDAVICLDQNHRISLFNPAAEKMFGYAAQLMLGHALDLLLPEESRSAHGGYIDDFATSKHTVRKMGALGQLQARRSSGELFPIEASISQGMCLGESVFTVILRDVTEQVRTKAELESMLERLGQANVQLQKLSEIDPLTLLPNRRMLFERLRLALNQSRRRGNHVCLAYIDLDGFKAINDLHGHDAGDAVLMNFSTELRNQLRDGDTLARIGGDEFIALLIDVDSLSQCMPTIERIKETAAQAVHFHGLELRVSASVGVALSAEDSDADELISRADKAMYIAKRNGKNGHAIAQTIE
jgi:diguanylate cyclase (GGDEF)-like protein/PAS domain S-box-containing protein